MTNPPSRQTINQAQAMASQPDGTEIGLIVRGAGYLVTRPDSYVLDAFGNVPVAQADSLFDAQQEYGLDTLRIWDATANGSIAAKSTNGSVSSVGNAVGPTNADTGFTPITVSATDTHYAVLQSRQYVRYIPGHGHRPVVTGVFAAGADYAASIVLRTSTSGTASDAMTAAQTAWSEDRLDGSGGEFNKSGLTLDLTKIQILEIDAQMLYAGLVRVGFSIAGCIVWAHQFEIANEQILPTMRTFNLPVRLEGRTDATTTKFRVGYFDSLNGVFLQTSRTTKGGTINFECCAVHSFGGREARGFPVSANRGVSRAAVTTRRPVFSIRPKATFNSKTNRAHIELAGFFLNCTTNNALYEVVIGGTLTGASFASVGDHSATEYDTAATAISGGVVIHSDYALSGIGAAAGSPKSLLVDNRGPLVLSQIDALAADQVVISLVCTAETGTSNVLAGAEWHEQTA